MGEEGRKYGHRLEIEAAENAIVVTAEQNVSTVQEKQNNEIINSVKQEHETVVVSITNETPQLQPQAEPLITPPIITEKSQSKKTPPALPEIRSEVPVYRFSAKEAVISGAIETHDFNRRMDIDCAETIDRAIQTHKKSDNSYDLTTPAVRLTKRYGKERMKWVLAQHIRAKPTGFSNDNFSWANVCMEEEPGNGDLPPTFTIHTHYAVLEAFTNEIRPILDQNPTFNERMKAAKKKSDAHNNSNG
jgi:hypothetical protein